MATVPGLFAGREAAAAEARPARGSVVDAAVRRPSRASE
jgi:hypothetical protein